MKRTLLMLAVFVLSAFQLVYGQRTVTGTVYSSEDNEPLPNATVKVKGVEGGTTTDLDGSFSIDVPAGSEVLVVSYIGMADKEVEIGTSNDLGKIELQPDLLKLNDIVVTALGIRREEKALGYSTQEIGGEDLINSAEPNVIQSLSAKSAGVDVISSGGTPGASSKILLRGNSTFTEENQPLIVVDGVPISNATENTIGNDYPFNEKLTGVNNTNRAIDINPDDIESVTVLKGPAAASLYGVRAGNGAIVITTKRGQPVDGKAVKATYSYNVDIATVNKLPKFQDTYAQGDGGGSLDQDGNPVAEGTYDVADPGPDGLWFTGDDVSYGTSSSWGPLMENIPGGGREPIDNVDRFYKTGVTHTNNLSLYGGGEQGTFRLSLGRTREDGVIPNSEFHRTSVRLTADTKISDKIKFGSTVNYINSGGTKVQNGSNLSGVSLSLFRTPSSFDLRGGGGEKIYLKPNGAPHQYFYAYDNPYWSVYENPFTNEVNRFLASVYFKYEPLSWLDFDLRLGSDFYADQRKQLYAWGSWEPTNGPYGGQIEENTISYREWYTDFLTNLHHDFNENISGSLTIGLNANERFSKDEYSRGRDFSIPVGFNNISNATNLYADEDEELIRTSAIFFDANAAFKNMLYLELTSRTEWSSTFGVADAFTYPSASASFVFSELLPKSKVFSFGKIRYAFAQAGISPPVYSNNTIFISPVFTDGFTDGLSFPYLGENGFGNSQLNILGNPDLVPERINGHEVGLDIRLWRGRLNIDYTYYHQTTTDIILEQPISTSSGYRFTYANAGEMVNKGHELVVTADLIRKKGFVWDLTVNFATNDNEVTKLAEGVDQIDIETAFSSIGAFAIVGEPYGSFFGTTWYKDDQGRVIINQNTGLPTINPKSAKIGNPYPDYTMGLGTGFSYKGIKLNLLFDIRQGNEGWCGTCARLNLLGRSAASEDRGRTYVIDGVAQTGTDPETGAPTSDGTPNTAETDAFSYYFAYVGDQGATEQQIFDASWFRLRQLSLSYRLDLEDVKFLSAIDFSFTARNLFVVTDYPGVDPETSLLGAGSNVNGFDYFNNPSTRSYNLGVKLFMR